MDRRMLWLGSIWLALQIPFVGGAFRVDDMWVLEMSKQILTDLTDPYGFKLNWLGTPEAAFNTYANPPLVSGWLALWSRVFPWNEISLHLAMLPFSMLALHAFWLLAKRYQVDALVATALLGCSPAFFLTSQVVMPDIAMLSLFLLAVSYAGSYEEGGSLWAFAVVWMAGFLCPLAKYNGLVLLPVLAWMALCGRRKWQMMLLAASPMSSLLLWSGYTWMKYGKIHFLAMSAFQSAESVNVGPHVTTVGVLAAVGMGVLPISLIPFVFQIKTQRKLLLFVAMWVVGCSFWLADLWGYPLASASLFALSVGMSIHLIALTLIHGWGSMKELKMKELSLVVWILSALLFQYGLMFTAVRYLLFLAPPIILLVLKLSNWVPRKAVLAAMIVANVILVVAIAIGDFQAANVYRDITNGKIRSPLGNHKSHFYFMGHWGFQHYAQQIGGEAVNLGQPPVFRVGDLIVVAPTADPKFFGPPLKRGVEVTQVAVEAPWYVRTLSCQARANFYANAVSGCWHPTFLPFGFSKEPLETFLFYRVTEK